MNPSSPKLNVLDTVDSTNNYAMGLLHKGMAEAGDAWLAKEQTRGKGRLGKAWQAEAGSNIMMSLVIEPGLRLDQQFMLSAAVATGVHKVLTKHIDDPKIKWPNDLYWRDRKAGGILIENIVRGTNWEWAVAGIGINVNQVAFDPFIPNPVSLKQVSGKDQDIMVLANEILVSVLGECKALLENGDAEVFDYYNAHLYKAGEKVWLKKENSKFETTVKKVLADGRLLVEDVMERSFVMDEVSWV